LSERAASSISSFPSSMSTRSLSTASERSISLTRATSIFSRSRILAGIAYLGWNPATRSDDPLLLGSQIDHYVPHRQRAVQVVGRMVVVEDIENLSGVGGGQFVGHELLLLDRLLDRLLLAPHDVEAEPPVQLLPIDDQN